MNSDWMLSQDMLNNLQQNSIESLVECCQQGSRVDVIVRYEGKDWRFEADWIKHLERVLP
jgi:hypothetical protein